MISHAGSIWGGSWTACQRPSGCRAKLIPVHDIDSALEVIRARDESAARLANGLWGAMRAGAAHPRVTRYDVQGVCWGALPLLACRPESAAIMGDRYAAAGVLAELLDLLGYPRYAEICRGSTTKRILEVAEDDDACTALVKAAWDSSGVEPPNTPMLTWGEARGPVEQAVHAAGGRLLEEAIEAKIVNLSRRDADQQRIGLMMRILASPAEGLPGTWFYQIFDERLTSWFTAGGSALRRELLVRVRPEVEHVPGPGVCDDPFPALQLLLTACRGDGVRLTRSGYLPTALVADMVGMMPACAEYPATARSESQLPALKWLRYLAGKLDLVRKEDGRLVLTALGEDRVKDAESLVMSVGEGLVSKDSSVRGVIEEVILAGLLLESRLDPDRLLDKVCVVVEEEGWGAGPHGLSAVDLAPSYGSVFLRGLQVVDALDVNDDMGLTEAGRIAARWGLRARVMLREVPG